MYVGFNDLEKCMIGLIGKLCFVARVANIWLFSVYMDALIYERGEDWEGK